MNLKCTLTNDMAEVAAVQELLEQNDSFSGMTFDAQYKLSLTLEEMISNCIKYSAASAIELEVIFAAGGVTVLIADDGLPFDPLKNSGKATVCKRIEDQPIGGMGIFLVREMAQRMNYSRRDNCNVLEIVISL